MKDSITRQFVGLSTQNKALVLARSSHDLTVLMRGVAMENNPRAVEKLRAINEVLHSMTGKLRDLLSETGDQYPDEVFLEIISEKARGYCAKALDQTMERAIAKTR